MLFSSRAHHGTPALEQAASVYTCQGTAAGLEPATIQRVRTLHARAQSSSDSCLAGERTWLTQKLVELLCCDVEAGSSAGSAAGEALQLRARLLPAALCHRV